MQSLIPHFLELLRRTSTDLPADVEDALRRAQEIEAPGSPARDALGAILQNVQLARTRSTPICQDTGTPIFRIKHPSKLSTIELRREIREAVADATAKSYLRPNCVVSLTGKNPGNNLGTSFPSLHFTEWDEDYLQVDLQLKGGGCENVGAQYTLPDSRFGADRDLEGVRKVVLNAIWTAQGMGCAPGVVGVAIGGDRGVGYTKSKEVFWRGLADENPDDRLSALEKRLTSESNELGIGPMGFGGNSTVLEVKIDATERHPACYFVTVSYMCWADRRRTLIYRDGRATID